MYAGPSALPGDRTERRHTYMLRHGCCPYTYVTLYAVTNLASCRFRACGIHVLHMPYFRVLRILLPRQRWGWQSQHAHEISLRTWSEMSILPGFGQKPLISWPMFALLLKRVKYEARQV